LERGCSERLQIELGIEHERDLAGKERHDQVERPTRGERTAEPAGDTEEA
jgi:hypothetical protein